jgi:dTMP kinase
MDGRGHAERAAREETVSNGIFITFEGTEGSGKSTQISLLAARLRSLGHSVRMLREPGGTPIGEEIRHTLKHSKDNDAMTAETELLLMNASRAQLVREVIRPALAAQEIVLCDRFYDSTTAYQGYGRQLDLAMVQAMIDVAVGPTRPDLTLLLLVSHEASQQRRLARQSTLPFMRDRIEEADQAFFQRVAHGYLAIAAAEPARVKQLDAIGSVGSIAAAIWTEVQRLLQKLGRRVV